MLKQVQGFLAILTLLLLLPPAVSWAQTGSTTPTANPALSAAAAGPAATASNAAGDKIVLTAEQSTGGRILTLAGGTKAVTIDTSCKPNFKTILGIIDAFIGWKLDAPLPPGWWRGTLEFGVPEGEDKGYANTDMQVVMVSPTKTSVPVSGVSSKSKDPQRFVFWIYSLEPITDVQVKAGGLWLYKRTLPFTQCTLERGQPSALTRHDMVAMHLPVQPDGSVALPPGMPQGMWSLDAAVNKGARVVLTGADSRSFEVPGSCRFYIESPLQKIVLPPGSPAKTVALQNTPDYSSSVPTVPPEPALMTTVDASKPETAQLEMIGANLTGDAPVLPLLPMGKKTAVIATWDDGPAIDLRMAELMHRLGFHPTFLVNQNSPAMNFLDKLEALGAEVGSHGYHHPFFSKMPPQSVLYECAAMRQLLEEKLKHPVISFAYPNGYSPAYDAEGDYVLRAMKAAGYWSGRTTWSGCEVVDSIAEPLTFKTAGWFAADKRSIEKEWNNIRAKEGGIYLLWGHTWQLGSTDAQWKAHEDYLAKYANLPDCWYPTQGQVFTWVWLRKNVQLTVTDKSPNKVSVRVTRPWLHPYLAGKCPLSLKVPAGVQKVRWQGQDLAVTNGFVELP